MNFITSILFSQFYYLNLKLIIINKNNIIIIRLTLLTHILLKNARKCL